MNFFILIVRWKTKKYTIFYHALFTLYKRKHSRHKDYNPALYTKVKSFGLGAGYINCIISTVDPHIFTFIHFHSLCLGWRANVKKHYNHAIFRQFEQVLWHSYFKGTVSRDILFVFFSWIIFPQAFDYKFRVISNYCSSKTLKVIYKSRCTNNGGRIFPENGIDHQCRGYWWCIAANIFEEKNRNGPIV